MRSDAIEEALRDILGGAVAPEGLVITLRRHDEYEALIERIRSLEAEVTRKDRELRTMATYPVLYMETLDELRYAVKLLAKLGIDTTGFTSVRPARCKSRA